MEQNNERLLINGTIEPVIGHAVETAQRNYQTNRQMMVLVSAARSYCIAGRRTLHTEANCESWRIVNVEGVIVEKVEVERRSKV